MARKSLVEGKIQTSLSLDTQVFEDFQRALVGSEYRTQSGAMEAFIRNWLDNRSHPAILSSKQIESTIPDLAPDEIELARIIVEIYRDPNADELEAGVIYLLQRVRDRREREGRQ